MPDVASSLGKTNVLCYRSVACAVELAERDRARQASRLTGSGGPLKPLTRVPQVSQDRRFSNDKHEAAWHATWKSSSTVAGSTTWKSSSSMEANATWKSSPSVAGYATWKSFSSAGRDAKKAAVPPFARTDGFRMTAKKPPFMMSPDAQHVHYSPLTNRWVPPKRSTLASRSSPLKKPAEDSVPEMHSVSVSKETTLTPKSTVMRESSKETMVSDDTEGLPDSNSLIEMQVASRHVTDELNFMLHRLYDGLDGDETARLQKQRRTSRHNVADNAAGRSSGSGFEPFWQQKAQRLSTCSSVHDVHTHRKAVRDAIRKALVQATGGSWEAYRFLVANNSNSLSLADFFDGLERLSIDWAEVTSITRKTELFKLLDKDASGFLDLQDLFPMDAMFMSQMRRTSTPDFWKSWCRRNKAGDIGAPSWRPERERYIQLLKSDNEQLDRIAERRKWIKQTAHRLKSFGKSDSCVRHIVCRHLPRGTAPSDRDRVPGFSREDLRGCKRVYSEEVRKKVQKIQKSFRDFGNMRRQLRHSRRCLNNMMDKMTQKKEEEERQVAAQEIAEARSALGSTRRKTNKNGVSGEISEEEHARASS